MHIQPPASTRWKEKSRQKLSRCDMCWICKYSTASSRKEKIALKDSTKKRMWHLARDALDGSAERSESFSLPPFHHWNCLLIKNCCGAGSSKRVVLTSCPAGGGLISRKRKTTGGGLTPAKPSTTCHGQLFCLLPPSVPVHRAHL
jgi:hypothetical protein